MNCLARVLLTVLFTDIVESTKRAAALGDHRWSKLLAQHDAAMERRIEAHRGRLIKATGDGVLAGFDGPSRAVQCALEAREDLRTLGLDIRAGIHTGECEERHDDLSGIAVHIASRILGEAQPGVTFIPCGRSR